MKESEERMNSVEEKKEKIRERYRGVSENELSVIPAQPKPDIFDRERDLRVAVYARVSTDDPNQTSSYELQKNHYTDLINTNPNWHLVDIYADEGISGTSLKHRDEFLRMMKDCKEGKIDLIVTKNVSRFARNILDSIGNVRTLAGLNPPVGVFFEAEHINTLKGESEMTLAFMATMAQEESHNKSEVMNASVEMRFKRGIFLTPPLLGYDQDENGNLVINEEEANTIRLIFFLFLYSYSTGYVAEKLTELKRETKTGKTVWTTQMVTDQLTNERHCGSVLARKTFTPNYIDHKSKKNRHDRNQYFHENHHEPIISREDFICVQHILANARPGSMGILPELHAIKEGALKGFVSVNPRWKGFKAEDYLAASKSVCEGTLPKEQNEKTIQGGSLDLRGYEVVRSQFVCLRDRRTITFDKKSVSLSSASVRSLESEFVELLIHPVKGLLVVRPAKEENRLSFRCAKKKEGALKPNPMNCSPILPNLFKIFDWKMPYSYRMEGVLLKEGEERLLLFDTGESERLIPNDFEEEEETFASVRNKHADYVGTKKKTLAFPASWAEGFGEDYYVHGSAAENLLKDTLFPEKGEISVYRSDPEINVPDPQILKGRIRTVMENIEVKETADD